MLKQRSRRLLVIDIINYHHFNPWSQNTLEISCNHSQQFGKRSSQDHVHPMTIIRQIIIIEWRQRNHKPTNRRKHPIKRDKISQFDFHRTWLTLLRVLISLVDLELIRTSVSEAIVASKHKLQGSFVSDKGSHRMPGYLIKWSRDAHMNIHRGTDSTPGTDRIILVGQQTTLIAKKSKISKNSTTYSTKIGD